MYLPFIKSIPYLDGNIDFVQSYHFFTGGFPRYFTNWGSVHPPLKIIFSALFFSLFGVNPVSYNILGFLTGVVAIWAFYRLARRLFNQHSANIAAIILATSPLFLSTSIFSLRDNLMVCFILLSLYFYSLGSYPLCLFFSALSFLSKESGLLLIICVILVEIIALIKNRKPTKLLVSLLGLVTPIVWWHYLAINHKKSWSDWLFSENASRGTYYTMVKNIFSLKIFNRYAYQHWLHLFIMNFNWMFWLIIIVGICLTIRKFKKKSMSWLYLLNLTQKQKTVLAIILFCFGYFFTALCLQTYAIPRYILPVLSFTYLLTAFFLSEILDFINHEFVRTIIISTMVLLIFSSLFFSIDPLSDKIWGRVKIFSQSLYGLNNHLSGNDGITYNLQFLFLTHKRSNLILTANSHQQSVISSECLWVFPDPRNDFQTLKILNFKGINLNNPCNEKN